jgi:hypothetical protein
LTDCLDGRTPQKLFLVHLYFVVRFKNSLSPFDWPVGAERVDAAAVPKVKGLFSFCNFVYLTIPSLFFFWWGDIAVATCFGWLSILSLGYLKNFPWQLVWLLYLGILFFLLWGAAKA